MKGTELRLANWVSRSWGKGKPLQISGFMADTVWFKYGKNEYFSDLKNIKPIPLTEEWLVKFGFYNCDNSIDRWFQISRDSLLKIFVSANGDTFLAFYGDERIMKIDYLHQLQNLYFALTNKELEISE